MNIILKNIITTLTTLKQTPRKAANETIEAIAIIELEATINKMLCNE